MPGRVLQLVLEVHRECEDKQEHAPRLAAAAAAYSQFAMQQQQQLRLGKRQQFEQQQLQQELAATLARPLA